MKPKSQDLKLARKASEASDDPALLSKVIERMLQLSAENSALKRRLKALIAQEEA